MGFTLYDATILTAKAALSSLTNVLKLAEQQPNSANLLTAQLYEDMKPLTFQVHQVTQKAEDLVARLTLREAEKFENDFSSFADFYARIDKALKSLDAVDKDTINTRGEELAPTKIGPSKEFNITGATYANATVIPNIYFHLSIAYAILRKEGVPLGKRDYLTSFLGLNVNLQQ
ncbi:hypothetical protein BGW36DRAFT_354926 [Talaromyces proteolyticus]|uniref:DUF1993 domain-containing protein n=1 Tax=Talaromyces proteolyticus TaxID=1131652 RepID=A0AAD4KZJ9_9EURO|nr:uncharacterized protein BGW36DRAFT_354926 [Talaromyces proteolyticus]KAH8703508.1 hypothetical protein BGW36DRAFT_354926 [Talaromyces proteolyticus]